MARERSSRRAGEDAAPEAAPAGARGARDRGGKAAGGGSSGNFAVGIAMAAGIAAAAFAFIAAIMVGGKSSPDVAAVLDRGGVQAVRMLAAAGAERWRPGFGTTADVRKKVNDRLNEKLTAFKTLDRATYETVKTASDEWVRGQNLAGAGWRPGLDLLLPPDGIEDTAMETARMNALANVEASTPGAFIGASIQPTDPSKSAYAGTGANYYPVIKGKDAKATHGPTEVYETDSDKGLIRVYVHPLKDRDGKEEGKAVVSLLASGTAPPSAAPAAGAAAAGAFVGAFLLALLMGMGPVKALRKLAEDSDVVAKGNFTAPVAVQGPRSVQVTAKNIQKLGALAASGGGGPPQIVQQQVLVQPTQEVAEGLAPTKGFKRPEEFEVEATQKGTPDLGNDYYDVINVDDEHVGILVADIPNMRGVRGAMYMAQVRALFRAVAPREKSPAEVLKLLNRVFSVDLPRGVYVTAIYCVVSRTTGICRVASAQHLPLVIYKIAKKASAKVPSEGIALGLDPGPVFDKAIAEKAIQLDKGDRILLYTDGAITAKNPGGAEYGEERFYYVLNKEAPKNSAACVNFVANDFDLFHEGGQQLDDFTVVTLRRMK